MFNASFALIMGLFMLAALLRLSCHLVVRLRLPWGRAFGLAALISLVHRGQPLLLTLITGSEGAPPLPVLITTVGITFAAAVGLSSWIIRDENGAPIGVGKGLRVAGAVFAFLGALAALLYANMPANPP